ncbi:MAG: FecR domain-containing protein [Deltaproteobacteria bacterium]|nr:FecR domain-containing protein [Deltaproteobacteria bacterium]
MPISRRLAVLAPLLLASVPALASEQAGVSAAVRGQVALTRPQEAAGRQIAGGEPILMQDAIRSGLRSGAQILLLDQTVFTIGAESEVVVDEFVYDPQTSAGRMSARVAQGVFRFVSGKMAKDQPQDVTVRLPTGTLGIRGTLVAGRVDDATKRALIVLLGEGRENDLGSPAGAIDVCNAGTCVSVRSAGFGTRIDGPDSPPVEPYRIPEQEILLLTQSVSDPEGWLARAGSDGGLPAVSAGAPGHDPRSPTEVSRRSTAAAGSSATQVLRQLSDVTDVDSETIPATQDAQKSIETPFGVVTPGSADLQAYFGPMRPATYDDLPAVASAGVQTAVYERSGVALSDGGAYDFSLMLDLGAKSLLMQVNNVEAPSLGVSGESLSHVAAFEPPGFGTPIVVQDAGRFAGEGCGSGCNAFVQAYVFSDNGRLADSVLQSLKIVPPASEGRAVFTAQPYVELRRPDAP